MSFVPLSKLLSEGRDDDAVVAATAEKTVDFGTFRRDVAWNAARLRGLDCKRGLLAAQDCYWAAVGLMALHHAHATAIFPPNLRAGGHGQWGADCILSEIEASDVAASGSSHCRLEPGKESPQSFATLDPCCVRLELFTAGSTGQHKRVTKTLADMEAEAREIHLTLGRSLRPGAMTATVPYHHLYGLTFRLVWPLCAGWRIAGRTHEYWESLAADLAPDAILVTSPAHLTRLPPSEIPADRRPQLVLSAGAALSDEAAEAAAAYLGTPVTDIFGSTETGVIAYRHRTGPRQPWRPFANVKVKPLEDGRLAVRSPHMSGHAANGWFETEDLMAPGDDRSFHLRGRADRVVKIEGIRISLLELEQKLLRSPLVADAAVVGLQTEPDSLGAAIVLTDEGRHVLAEIEAFRLGRRLRRELARTIAPSGLPRRWRFLDRLPQAVLGKRRQDDIRALFQPAADPNEPALIGMRSLEGGVELDLFIPADLVQLRGHFKDFPVLPGVAQIDWAVRFSAKYLDVPIDAGRAFQIKFRRVTTAPSSITLKLMRNSDRRQIEFEYRQDGSILSTGALKLEAPE
jgi:acyl-coenzyme A synthetase/AMP-(fatty) acid ligase